MAAIQYERRRMAACVLVVAACVGALQVQAHERLDQPRPVPSGSGLDMGSYCAQYRAQQQANTHGSPNSPSGRIKESRNPSAGAGRVLGDASKPVEQRPSGVLPQPVNPVTARAAIAEQGHQADHADQPDPEIMKILCKTVDQLKADDKSRLPVAYRRRR